jgi:ATP-dependent RNA helicase RhlE
MDFKSLKLIPELEQAIAQSGYKTPSPIQQKAIPEILAGKDLLAAAQTGTGKTAGFTLPILQMLAKGPRVKANQARVLILTPTRELAQQVANSVQTYGKHLALTSLCVHGGVNINPQMQKLRKGVDILIATPGRLLDLVDRNSVKFPSLEFLVLDEADRMLDMGFLPDIKRVIKLLPNKRQTLLFSATFSDDIKQLATKLLNNPVSVSVSHNNSTATTVKQWFHPVDKKRKAKLISYLIGKNQWYQVLIFVRTKRGANKVAYDLQKDGINADVIHGNKSQGARNRVLKEFKAGKLQALVATDIAARGLDIEQLPLVINHDLPHVAEDYVHRIGRTGRAGKTGHAISLVSADEIDLLSAIEGLIKKKLKRVVIEDFDPKHVVPESKPKTKPKKKPHKKKIAKLKQKKPSNRR